MPKERWKKCPTCQIFTDVDEVRCPRYGEKSGHELQVVYVKENDIKNLHEKRKILTKHIAELERRLP
jgi:hypothetical protein